MGRINIYMIQNYLEENGWKLESTEYKNLDEELVVRCPKGHQLQKTYRVMREKLECEQCIRENGGQSILHNKIPDKKNSAKRILALDAATTTTGYSIFDNSSLVSYGTFTVRAIETTERIAEVKQWVLEMVDKVKPDVVGLEDIQLQGYNNQNMGVTVYKALAELQGVLKNALYEKNVEVMTVYANEWRRVNGISGGPGDRASKKRAAQDRVKKLYNLNVTQDEADAICQGYYFTSLENSKLGSWGKI